MDKRCLVDVIIHRAIKKQEHVLVIKSDMDISHAKHAMYVISFNHVLLVMLHAMEIHARNAITLITASRGKIKKGDLNEFRDTRSSNKEVLDR